MAIPSEVLAIFLDGLLQYILLCFVSIAMGLSLLRLFRIDLPPQMAIAFAPVLTAACWAVLLGIGVTLRIPVRLLAWPVWIVTAGLVVYCLMPLLARVFSGARKLNLGFTASAFDSQVLLRRNYLYGMVRRVALLSICVVLPIAVMLPFFLGGLSEHPRSVLPDGWAYTAYGQYLWTYSRGADGRLAPLYQLGARFSSTRFISSSLLGFFSPLFSAGDTQMSSGLFVAWTLFTFSSSCAFFGLTQALPTPWLFIYPILAVFSGWICNMLWANNYDNALAIVYFPALVGSVMWLDPRRWPWRFVIGILVAGLSYCYPELAAFILFGVVLVALDRYRTERHARKDLLSTALVSGLVALVLVAPYIPEMFAFTQRQVASGLQTSQRPGEGLFGGLVQLPYQPSALWGLGGEYNLDSWLPVRNALGFLLSALTVLGIWQLIKHRLVGFALSILMLITISGVFIVVYTYSYGAYKIILLAWWAICYAIVFGLVYLFQRIRAGVFRYAAIGLCSFIALLTLLFNHYGISAPSRVPSKFEHLELSQFRQLEQIGQITKDAGVAVLVDDWLANEWAVYFLRDIPIDLGAYRMYMSQTQAIPFMNRAKFIRPEDIRYVLTDSAFDPEFNDSSRAKLIWSGGPYHLWDTDIRNNATITTITNANGVQQKDGERFFWMGQGDTILDAVTYKEGVLHIKGTFLAGLSAPDNEEYNLIIMTDSGYQSQFALIPGDREVVVPVVAGRTRVTIRLLDKPTVKVLPNGDTRPFILGIKGIAAAIDDNPVVLEQVVNQHKPTELDGESFFWMGRESTKIRVYSIQDGMITLRARFRPGPSLPETEIRSVLVESDTGHRSQVSIARGEQQIVLPVQSGMTTVTLTVLDAPTTSILTNGDTRTLLLGVQGLTVQLEP